MKQVLQNLKTGDISVSEVPSPIARPKHLVIQTRRSLISAGTERMIVEFGSAGIINKARSQPEQVRKVLAKMKTEGIIPTVEAVFARLDEPMPLGYCNSGVVVEVGQDVTGFKPGDRVASNGPHAEIVSVPMNLCAKIPDGVSDQEAGFTVLSSIAMQGIRLLQPTLGESFVVTGLGLIGIVAVQLLRANGCRVLGIDPDPVRLELARSFGAEVVDLSAGADPISAAEAFTGGRGVDGVLIAASAKGDEIVHQSAEMCRKRGRIVLVGVVGLGLQRKDFYDKELTFQVSCSYGPGRYDRFYEDQGNDYPLPFVRWTEQRNMEAVLSLLESGALDVKPLVSRTFPHAESPAAYEALKQDRSLIGIVLEYPDRQPDTRPVVATANVQKSSAGAGGVVAGVIGAGNFSRHVALPTLAGLGVRVACVTDLDGVAAADAARKFGVECSATDYQVVIQDESINTVFVLTRHDTHAALVAEALEAGKHVCVEKPLALDVDGLRRVGRAVAEHPDRQVLVGFNRRFAPLAATMRQLLAGRAQPLCMTMMVNARALPADHWTLDPKQGGGRIIGEGCHWIDLMVSLAGARVESVTAKMIGRPPAAGSPEDTMSLTMSFEDGSLGTVHYFPNGDKRFPKERLEVFSEGRILVLDNFRTLRGFGFSKFKSKSLRRLDKGHRQEYAEFVDRVKTGGEPLIPFDQLVNTTLTTFAAIESARSGQAIRIDPSVLNQSTAATG